jgi:hypothetical protein
MLEVLASSIMDISASSEAFDAGILNSCCYGGEGLRNGMSFVGSGV